MMAAVAAVVERFGGLDIAVANAGIAPPTVTTARTMPPEQWRAGRRRQPDRRLAHGAGGAAAGLRARRPARLHRLDLQLLQRHPRQPLRGLQGRGRGAGPGAAGGAGAAGRERQRRLLRLGRHRAGARVARPPGRGPRVRILGEILPGFLLRRIRPPGRGDDRAGAGERAPRAFAPRVWRYISALRGLLNPLLDRRMDRDATIAAVVTEVEAAQRASPAARLRRRRSRTLPGRCPSTTSTAKSRWSPAPPAGSASRRRARCTCAAPRSPCSTSTPRRRARRPSGSGRGRSGSAPTSPTRTRCSPPSPRWSRSSAGSTSPSPTPASPRSSSPPPAASPARSGSASSRSTCSASGAPCARRCRRSSSARARWSSSPPSTPSPTAWATPPTPSPRPGSRCSGRSLRVELAPHGASASVAYFGWVDTKLVQDAFDQEDSGRIRELSPDFLLKRITPDEAGAGLVRGIEERAPRIFVPKWWRYVSAFRGLVNPLLDRRMESDAKTRALIRDLDAKARRASRASRSAPAVFIDGELHLVVEGLRCDVGLVGPSDRRSVDEEHAEKLGSRKGSKTPPKSRR